VARAIAEMTPGFDDPFHRPRRQDDDALLMTAAVFLDEVQARKERFVRHSLSETFVAELQELVDRFAQTVRAYASAKERRSLATRGMNAAVVAGLAAIRQLDVIVPHRLGHDSDALALWEQARKMEFPSRRRSVVSPLMPAVLPTSPVGIPPAAPEETASTSAPASTATPAASVEADADQPSADIPLPKAS
jgi:hypothetical protein